MAQKQKNKVYFWLKLDQNFFKNLAIKQALRMPGGKDMIIVYQMLMLESLVTDGVIYYEGMLPTLEKELAVRLDVKEEDIQMTLAYFKNVGLVQVDDSNNAEMLQVPALIEQETDWARYKREQRRALKLDNVQHVSNGCPTELELELELEKDIDIELDVDKKKTATDANVFNYYQQRIGPLDGFQYEQLKEYITLDGMEIDVVIRAITEAADNGKRNFKYILAILRNWKQNSIKTIVQVEERDRQRIEQKANSYQNGNNSQTQRTNVPDWSTEPVKVEQTTEGQAKLAELFAELEQMEKRDG